MQAHGVKPMTPTLTRRLTLIASAALVAGPLSSSSAILDKTRFVAHLGVAYYAFHHWVWQPYKAGGFAKGSAGQVGHLAKAGLALAFAAHEVNVSEKIARNSRDPLLQKLDAELVKLQGSFTNIGAKMKNGQFSEADVQALNDATTSIGQTSAAGGRPIQDKAVVIPGVR